MAERQTQQKQRLKVYQGLQLVLSLTKYVNLCYIIDNNS